MQPEKYFISQKFRPSPLPIKGLPLGVRAVGHFITPQGHIPPARYSTYTVIAWGIHGGLKVTIDDIGQFVLTSEQFIVITPGLKFSLEAVTERCEFRYMAIDGPQCDAAALSAGLWTGLFPSREVPSGWLDGLTELVASEDRDDQILAISRAHDLITYQAGVAKELTGDNLVYQAQWHIQKNWHDSNLNIESVLNHLKVDRATLSTRFKKRTGITMVEYLTRLRIGNAKRLLSTTIMPIAYITRMCGFRDASYFARIFRKRTGCTPMQYRLRGTKIALESIQTHNA